MSQPSVPWTNATIDSFLPSPEPELYTQAQIEAAFAQHASDQPDFASTYNDDLQIPAFTYDCGSILNTDSSEPSTVSTPNLSSHSFGQQSPAYALSGASTPYLYPLEQQAYHTDHQHEGLRTVPFHAHTDSSLVLTAPPPRSYHRRRSLSHGDIDRIATGPSHPTFVRLQGHQGSRAISAASEDDRRSGQFTRHGSSISQGPSPHIRGRPLKDAVPYQVFGKDKKERKGKKRSKPSDKHDDNGETSPKFSDPLIRKMTGPAQLAKSRRIIEIGAMAVRNHSKIDPSLEDNDNMSPHERILKKLEDVERYLQQDAAKNEEALKGCALIRVALKQRAKSIDAAVTFEAGDVAVENDALEAPSTVMAEGDLGLFGGCLDEGDLMSLLIKESEHTAGGEEEEKEDV